MTEWKNAKTAPPDLPGFYLITVKVYIDNKWDGKTVGTSAAHWHNKTWLGRIQGDVIAWAKLPDPYKEPEQITIEF